MNTHGALSLNQLNTPDPDAASAFYSERFGWSIREVADTDTPYWGIYRGEALNGGMMLMPAEMQAPPHWLIYFGMDDLDAATAKIGDGGGTIMLPKMEVPGGRIVVAQDAQGAVFGLFAGRFDD